MAGKEVVKALILFKLFRKGKIGGAHTDLRNASKGIKEDSKIVKKAIEELNKENLLLGKKSTGEIHVSLNSHKMGEIKNYIKEYLDIDVGILDRGL